MIMIQKVKVIIFVRIFSVIRISKLGMKENNPLLLSFSIVAVIIIVLYSN